MRSQVNHLSPVDSVVRIHRTAVTYQNDGRYVRVNVLHHDHTPDLWWLDLRHLESLKLRPRFE